MGIIISSFIFAGFLGLLNMLGVFKWFCVEFKSNKVVEQTV